MNRLQPLFATLIVLAVAPLASAELLPPHLASQLGLEQAWSRQLHVPAGAQSIVDQQIYVHQDNQREYVEVVGGPKGATSGATSANPKSPNQPADVKATVLVRIATDRVGRNGLEIGKAEAERLARNEVRRLEYRGYDAKIVSQTIPKVRLYTLSDDGTLECRDAESGEPVWMTRVGDRRLSYSQLGVDENFISVINGGNLIKIDATNGEEIVAVRTQSMPLFGALHAGDFTLFPTIRNGIEGYALRDTTREPFMEIVEGLALAPPAKSAGSTRVAWGTNKGFIYVMESSGTPLVLFRLKTDGIVSGKIAATANDHFYFGSEIGQVYGVKATRTGKVLWSQPYGEPFYNAPLVIGDQLLIRSTYGNLYSLGTADGLMTWTDSTPNIDELIAAFDGKLYVKLLSGGLAAIDLGSGKTIKTFNAIQPRILLPNTQTDRLYLVGETGSVQCLRPVGATLPTLNPATKGRPSDAPPEESAEDEPVGPSAMAAAEDAPTDPFAAGGGDPFGASDAADPFGAADGAGTDMADPFAPAGGGDGADPFSDPFGN